MAITTTQQTSIMKASSALFNKAFSPEMVTDFVSFYESNGNDLAKLADALIGSSTYTAQYAGAATVAEFGTILMAHYGLSYTGTTAADTNMKDFINYSFEHKASWATSLQTIQAVDKYLTATFIPSLTTTDTVWGTMATAIENKATVATNFKNNTSNAGKELSLVSVTSDPATVTASTATATAGQTFTLTTGSDTGAAFLGTAGNDVYTAGNIMNNAGALTDTLQNVDSLDGGAGTDTLNATLNGASVVLPTLANIENVNVRLTNAASAIDLSAATGVKNLTINNSTVAQTATNTVGDVATLGVKNQNTAVIFDKSTATTLGLNFDNAGVVSATAEKIVAVDLGKTTAAKATTMNVTMNNSNVTVDSTFADVATTITVAAKGTNKLILVDSAKTATSVSVTGTGSVDMMGAALVKVATFTAADGGVKADMTANTATALTVTTGTGADTLTVTGANLTSLNSGAGIDIVTVTSALKATSTVDLGAGDDTITLNAAPIKGVTIAGGDGEDTIAMNKTIYSGMLTGGTPFSAAELAKITGFETLSITDALTSGTSYDVSAITGIKSFTAAAGVLAGSATASNLGANSTVTIAGGNTASAKQATITLNVVANWAADDVITVNINGSTLSYTVLTTDVGAGDKVATSLVAAINADATLSKYVSAVVTTAQTLITLTGTAAAGNFTVTTTPTSTSGTAVAVQTVAFDATAAGALVATLKADTSDDAMTLVLNNNYIETNDGTATVTAFKNTATATDIETLTVKSTGTANAVFAAASGTKADGVNNTLTLTDTKLVTLNITGDQAFTFASAANMTKLATIDASANTAGVTIDASLAAASSVAITIKGTEKADTITGGALGDTITLGGGNDTVNYAAGVSKIGTGTFDTITDFKANTVGDATTAAKFANADSTKWNGDVLKFDANDAGTTAGVKVDVLTSAADATTFLANNKSATDGITAALDSTNSNLYVDNTGDGVADFYIHLTGVTTIDAAAFVLV